LKHHTQLELVILNSVTYNIVQLQYYLLQLKRLSRRAGAFFEISDLEALLDFFRNHHFRHLELVFGRFIQRTNRNLKTASKNALGYRDKLNPALKGYCAHFNCQTDFCFSWAPGAFL